MMDEILVGLDGSPASCQALTWAADAATAFDTGIVGVFILTPSSAFRRDLSLEGFTTWRRQLRRRLDHEWMAPARVRGLDVRSGIVECETVAAGLLRSAEDIHARLIVLGASSRPHPLGSISDRVAHHASQPLVVVPLRGQTVIDLRPASRRTDRVAAS